MKKKDGFTVQYSEDFMPVAGISVAENTLSSYSVHAHDHYELEYIAEGKVRHKLNNKISIVSAGDLIFLTPMDLHSYEKIDGIARIITIHFNLEHVETAIGLHNLNAAIVRCSDDMKRMIYMIKKEYDAQDKYSIIAMRKIVEFLLIYVKRTQKQNKEENIPKGIFEVIGYINKNFKEPMDLDLLCNKFHYSKSNLCRQFKKYTGMTFVEYLNNLRLMYAKNMLEQTKIPIVELSYECGFGSVRNFIREFKKKYNCTPGKYR